jgi:hypothetical protein
MRPPEKAAEKEGKEEITLFEEILYSTINTVITFFFDEQLWKMT